MNSLEFLPKKVSPEYIVPNVARIESAMNSEVSSYLTSNDGSSSSNRFSDPLKSKSNKFSDPLRN